MADTLREKIEALRDEMRGHEPSGLRDESGAVDMFADKIDALLRDLPASDPGWRAIASAPKDGTAVLLFGIHDHHPITAQRGVQVGDWWQCIAQWDIWRKPARWVFAKDGDGMWSEPIAWQPLPAPPSSTGADETTKT